MLPLCSRVVVDSRARAAARSSKRELVPSGRLERRVILPTAGGSPGYPPTVSRLKAGPGEHGGIDPDPRPEHP
jgi:hypothetical protein